MSRRVDRWAHLNWLETAQQPDIQPPGRVVSHRAIKAGESLQTEREGGTFGHAAVTETWTSSFCARVYLKLGDGTSPKLQEVDSLVWSVCRLSFKYLPPVDTGAPFKPKASYNWFLRQSASTHWSAHTQEEIPLFNANNNPVSGLWGKKMWLTTMSRDDSRSFA